MTQRGRPGLSAENKDEVWIRWRRGESFSEIGRAVYKAPGSIYTIIQLYGGITPRTRQRSKWALTLGEREEISRGLASKISLRQIAKNLGRAPSTVSREINRHGGRKNYRAILADERAWHLSRRLKICKLEQEPRLRRVVSEKLSLQWSPEQISGWLKREYSQDGTMQISHETIYRSLFIQSRGVLKKELTKHLRTGRKMRQSKKYNTKGATRGQIVNGLSIRERPQEVAGRAIPGHWEGDLIAGSGNTHIVTLVERQSRFTILVKIDGKDAATVTSALTQQVQKLPSISRKTLTWDRGMELAFHKKLTDETNIQVYFCDPKSPWQRGTNENTNGLLRQYFPKKTDLSVHSQERLDNIALLLNQRPRKTLNFLTPAEKLRESVALTS